MANLTTAKDIVEYVLDRGGEPIGGTSDFDSQVLEDVNRVYQTIIDGGNELHPDINEQWWWARSADPGTITLQAAIEIGTVLVTSGSVSATLSASQAVSMVGWHFKVDDHADVFRVTAHTAGTTGLTLDSVYTGNDNTAATYRLAKLEYTLDPSDFRNVIAPMRVYQDNRARIDGVEIDALDNSWPLNLQRKGIPQAFAQIGEAKVRFSHYTDKLVRIDFDYIVIPVALTDDASSIPIVPFQYRTVIADFALGLLHEQKDDDRAANRIAAAQKGLEAMQREQRSRMARNSSRIGVISPRLMQRRPLPRTTSGLYLR